MRNVTQHFKPKAKQLEMDRDTTDHTILLHKSSFLFFCQHSLKETIPCSYTQDKKIQWRYPGHTPERAAKLAFHMGTQARRTGSRMKTFLNEICQNSTPLSIQRPTFAALQDLHPYNVDPEDPAPPPPCARRALSSFWRVTIPRMLLLCKRALQHLQKFPTILPEISPQEKWLVPGAQQHFLMLPLRQVCNHVRFQSQPHLFTLCFPVFS